MSSAAHEVVAAAPDAGRRWEVLLVGGASGVGKSAVARMLARRFDVGLAEADGYRLLLERMTTSSQWPALHAAAADPADTDDAETLCARWIDAAAIVAYGLEVVIAFHAATRAATVLEGDIVTPALAARPLFAELPMARRVRAVFLHEPDPERLRGRLERRGRGFCALPVAARERAIRRSMLYGDWLRADAERLALPVVTVDGTASEVAERVARAIGD